MRILRTMCIGLLLIAAIASCAQDTCPVAVKSDYYFKKKVKVHHSKRKPSPSLIHFSRVTYKPEKN